MDPEINAQSIGQTSPVLCACIHYETNHICPLNNFTFRADFIEERLIYNSASLNLKLALMSR